MKQYLAMALVAVLPLASGAQSCEPTASSDESAVVQCDTKGLKKVSAFARGKPGKYLTCGGPRCQYSYKVPVKGMKELNKRQNYTKYPKWVTLPNNMAKNSFRQSGCNGWYKK